MGESGLWVDPDRPVQGAIAEGVTHDISEQWGPASAPLANNVKFLSFAMMQSEVARATGVAFTRWAALEGTFGPADFRLHFSEDRLPNGTKWVAWRKLAYEVCRQVLDREATAATPLLFTERAPGAAIAPGDPTVAAQTAALWKQFFLTDPSPDELEASVASVVELATQSSPAEAWVGLCAAYLSSARFLSY